MGLPKNNPDNSSGSNRGFGGANTDKLNRMGFGNQGQSGQNGQNGNELRGNGQNTQGSEPNLGSQGSQNPGKPRGGFGQNNGRGGQSNNGGKFGSHSANGDQTDANKLSGQGQSNGGRGGFGSSKGQDRPSGGFGAKGAFGSNDQDGGQNGGGTDKLGSGQGAGLKSGQLGRPTGGFGAGAASNLSDTAKEKGVDALKGDNDNDLVDGSFNGNVDSGNQDQDQNDDKDMSGFMDGAKGAAGGLSGGLKAMGAKLPKPLRKAGSQLGKLYGKFNAGAVKGVMKVGEKSGMSVKTAQAMVHIMLATGGGFGAFGIYQVLNSQQTLNSHFVCATTNDSGSAFLASNDLRATPAQGQAAFYGSYTDKSSYAYQIYKMIYKRLLEHGLDLTQAAGIAGGVAQEDSSMDPIQGNINGAPGGGSDGGFGFFQVTPGTSGHDLQKYAAAHGVDLFANSSRTLDKSDPKQYAKAMEGMEAKVNVEVDEYYDDFIANSGYKNYRGTYQRMSEIAATVEAHGTVVANGLVPNSHLEKRMAGARFVMEEYAPSLHGIGPKLSVADANTGQAELENNINCNTQGYGDDGADGSIVSMAKQFLHKVPYSQASRGSITNNPPGGQADCSSFVWYILKQTGHKVPTQIWNTQSMVNGSNSQYLKIIPAREARAGDIFVMNLGNGLGDNGHTGILLQNWHGVNTMIINEGGSQTNVNISTFGEACYPALQGAKVVFVRPTS